LVSVPFLDVVRFSPFGQGLGDAVGSAGWLGQVHCRPTLLLHGVGARLGSEGFLFGCFSPVFYPSIDDSFVPSLLLRLILLLCFYFLVCRLSSGVVGSRWLCLILRWFVPSFLRCDFLWLGHSVNMFSSLTAFLSPWFNFLAVCVDVGSAADAILPKCFLDMV
jgi:hypothetical protein